MRPALVALLVVAAPALAQAPAPLIVNPRGRAVTSLDGEWHSIVDPYQTGYLDYRLKPNASGWFLDRKPGTRTDLVEYDFDRAPTLTVPADWNTQRPELLLYEGSVWYRQTFSRSLAPGRRLFVWFGG